MSLAVRKQGISTIRTIRYSSHSLHNLSGPSAQCLPSRIVHAQSFGAVRTLATQSRPQSTLSVHLEAHAKPVSNPDTSPSSKISNSLSSSKIFKSLPPVPGHPLSVLPTPVLLRSLLVGSITTAPALSQLLTKILLKYTSFFTKNPLLRPLLYHVFYSQFCAGQTKEEIADTVARLKSWGMEGMMLAYGREVESCDADTASADDDVKSWRDDTIRTIEYSQPEAFVSVKYSGAGKSTVSLLEQNAPQPDLLHSSLADICNAARSRNIKLLFDAEQQCIQTAIDSLTISLMRTFNKPSAPPTVYNTYQMYLCSSPATLHKHLDLAREQNFGFGAKIVRGAYLHSDPKEVFHEDKPTTDRAYDDAIDFLLRTDSDVPVGIVVATHNRHSVEQARDTYTTLYRGGQLGRSKEGVEREVTFGQLYGMADEVSLALISDGQGRGGRREKSEMGSKDGDRDGDPLIKVFKYVPWGTVDQCVKYLLRRADENKDSLSRTQETQTATWRELRRRMFG